MAGDMRVNAEPKLPSGARLVKQHPESTDRAKSSRFGITNQSGLERNVDNVRDDRIEFG